MRHRYLAAAIALALVGTLHAAHAAAAPRQDARDSRTTAANTARNDKAMPTSVTNLETVKVTARRYEETLQDVPIAVTALTARALTDNNVQNLADLQGLVPNLQIGPTQGTTSTLTVYLRGIGQNNPLWGFDPEVGLYLDGVYIARPQGALLDVFDVDRIEVLRGPQGTLYGKNTVGGAINFISKPLPTHETGSVTATLGMHATRDLKVDYGNASKDGVWRFRVAAATLHHGGYGHDLLTGSPNSNQDVNAARVSLGYFPSSAFNAQVELDGVADHSNPAGGQRLAIIPFDPAHTPQLSNPWNTQSDQPPVNLS
ncbi:MAG: TonB-dependent receptor, partial [Metallibacterium sp.]